MDMNGCEGIFRVSVDVYLYSCSKLECLPEGDKFSLLCRSGGWASMTESSHHLMVVCAVLHKAAAICEIFNVWTAHRLIS
jgi:hypothetical protein